ncbi:MAG: zinc ABC transporter substrate-binding protein [Desulfobulbaceae bacterium]|nr:zinc ABC transporter substrate-binding protein [Desulfobulbaceae bacterium]
MGYRLNWVLILIYFVVNPTFSQGAEQERLSVFVSILPEVYFVNKIGGDRVSVHALVRPGQSPATYGPTPKQMALLAKAHVYFRIGVGFENSLVSKLRRTNEKLVIVDLRDGISLLEMEQHGANVEDGHNHEEELDPHVWLDPMLVKLQAEVIKNTLSEFDPSNSTFYETNYKVFVEQLNKLDRQLRQTMAPLVGRTIYVFHPAYGYFCHAYGLKQKSVTINGKEPGAKHLVSLIKSARSEGVKVIFVQPQFSRKAARSIARAIDGVVVALDPLAKDYLENMESMAVRIRHSLEN